MVTTDDEELYHIMLSMRSHGWTRNLPNINHVSGRKSPDWFEESFKFVLPGYNLRPLELEGAIGLEQIKKLPNLVEARRQNASLFEKLFRDHELLNIQKELGESSWFGFAFVLKKDSRVSRSQVIALLSKENIECRPITSGDFTQNPVIKFLNYEISGDLINASHIHDNGFFVGNYHLK